MNIKIPSSCRTKAVEIKLRNENTGNEVSVLMTRTNECDGYETYSASFALPVCGLYFYYFFIFTEESNFSLYKQGDCDTNIEEGTHWQITCYDKEFSVPDSFKGKVMYQIFPDRFYREEVLPAEGKLHPYHVHENTDDIPDFMPDEKGEILNCDFFGGNLKGIEKKLDYLKELGVSIIYLNPIFKAYSNHRYDTSDYKTIDPLLGDEKDFVSLCDSAHKKGIKIILDGVFSHTGSRSIYFDRNHEFGSGVCSCENSAFKDWFNFKSFPDEYDTWWGIKTLPCVNEMSEGFLNYIIRDEDSVLAHWLRLGADGFRLDVADELPDEFIKLLRNRVKECKEESFVVGEVWEDASNKISYSVRRKYFSDAELDSVMNYVYKNAIIAFVKGDISSKDFEREIMTIAENYPADALHSLMNSLSTHDTERILTALSDADRTMTKPEKAGYKLSLKDRREALEKLFVATVLQFTLPGTACIYYGDEMAMEGFGDPFCRGYFTDKQKSEQYYETVKKLAEIKNKYMPLQMGNISFENRDDILILKRNYKEETITVLINLSDCEYATGNKDIIFSHNTSVIANRVFINKYGFLILHN